MTFVPKPHPPKVPLNLFQSNNYPLKDDKKGYEINWQVGQSTLHEFAFHLLKYTLSSTLQAFSGIFLSSLPKQKGAPNGRLKQLVGRTSTFQPKTLTRSSIFETSPLEITSLFSKLIFSLDIASNHIKTQFRYSMFSLLASQRMRVSFANNKWKTSTPTLNSSPN